MNLDQAALIAEIIGGIAVLATLIFLVIELRRNTEATRSATQQTQVDSIVAVNLSVANDPMLALLITKGNEDYASLTNSEELQLQTYYVNYFNLWHSAYWNSRKKLLDASGYEIWNVGCTSLLRNQGSSREAWAVWKSLYDEKFRTHVDRIIESQGEINSMTSGTYRNAT